MTLTLFDGLHHGLQQVMDLRQAQHALTASNIANADTPGYRARVIPFDQVLAEAVGQDSGVTLDRTHARHLGSPGADPSRAHVEELEPPPWSADGNSVVAEREMARLTENALLYRSVGQGIGRRLAMLRYAASNGQ